jgi:hypothetical protein
MVFLLKDGPEENEEAPYSSLKNCAAAQRALDYYLKPGVSEQEVKEQLFKVNESIGEEEALIHAADLMRCASAIAYESAVDLQGAKRDLAFSVVHMLELARSLMERSMTRARLLGPGPS